MIYPEQTVVRLPVNTAGRDFVVGDLHGCLGHLEVLMAAVRFDRDRDRLISVGDLVDRGPSSLALLQCLKEWPFFHAVVGNHELMGMEALRPSSPHAVEYHIWMSNGGNWAPPLTRPEWALVEAVFFSLPLVVELPLRDGRRVGVVHADFPLGRDWSAVEHLSVRRLYHEDADSEGFEKSLVWSRDVALRAGVFHTRWAEAQDPPRPVPFVPGIDLVISGHTICSLGRPQASANRWWIDTGAYLQDGALTLVEPLTGRYHQARWRRDGSRPLKRVTRGQMGRPS